MKKSGAKTATYWILIIVIIGVLAVCGWLWYEVYQNMDLLSEGHNDDNNFWFWGKRQAILFLALFLSMTGLYSLVITLANFSEYLRVTRVPPQGRPLANTQM